MNLQEYISTGILESYLLGEVSEKERAEVELQLSQHQELRDELAKIEATMEALAMKSSIAPPSHLKNKILSRTTKETKVVPMSSAWKYAAAASITIALIASYFAYNYRSRWIESQTALDNLNAQNSQIAENYNTVNQKLDKIQSDLAIMENTAFRKVVMKGTANDLTAQASVYWNEATNEAYISIQNLKDISRENQYQLWAIVRGVPVDVGVFDKNFTGLFKMKDIKGASAFAITVEPRGGKAAPTLETMQVIGAVDRRAG